MSGHKIENSLPFEVNVCKNTELETPGLTLPEGANWPRAAERTVLLGAVSVYWSGNEYSVPILKRRTTGVRCSQDHDARTLRIVSHDTIVAHANARLPYDRLAYPIDVVRDEEGRVIGCRGFGLVEDGQLTVSHEIGLAEGDIANLQPPETWHNRANYPIKLYDPALVGQGPYEDEINPQTPPILELPVAPDRAVDIQPEYELDPELTQNFGVPIYKVKPGRVVNWPEGQSDGQLNIVHGRALKHAAFMGGVSLHNCVALGRRVRSNIPGQKTALGGRALYVPDLNPPRWSS